MMTLQGLCVQAYHHFSQSTLFIMDVTIGHIYNVHHSYKSGNLLQMEGSKLQKYLEHYQQQLYLFAPMVANSFGQCGPDCLKLFLANSRSLAQIQYNLAG